MSSALNWFEIPVNDIARAAAFYGAVLGKTFEASETAPGFRMAEFPSDDGIAGALVQGEGYVPSAAGSIIYLSVAEDLNLALARVRPAGGRVLMPKSPIGDGGFAAYVLDTEGNRVGLHSTI